MSSEIGDDAWNDLAPTPTSGNDEVTDAFRLILPLAKGYMAAHPIESNIRYVHTAEAALANVDAHPPVQPTELPKPELSDALNADTVEAFAKRYAAAVATQSATPVQPTEPITGADSLSQGDGAHVVTTDNPPVAGEALLFPVAQPTEPMRGQLLCLYDQWRCGRYAMPNSWCCELHHQAGFERTHPPVQPTEPK